VLLLGDAWGFFIFFWVGFFFFFFLDGLLLEKYCTLLAEVGFGVLGFSFLAHALSIFSIFLLV